MMMVDTSEADWGGAIARAREFAPFLARSLDKQPELAELLGKGDGEAALAWAEAQADLDDIAVGLRRHRLGLATALAIGDLAGAFALPRVLSELTRFADHALGTAIRTAIAERTDDTSSVGMIALALGKQGAGELNYSSDIDPILLFDPDILPRRAKDDPGEAAQRYARRIVKLLSETTAEGYVLRVDLRLRPASEINPLAVPKQAALTHYQSQALAWERAAFVRARAAAGDIEAGEAFLNEIAPFIWRTKLDFGAVDEIRTLTTRIRESHDGPPRPGPGFDVKRGRGGIREIEFFAQTHQLIHGGRDPSLRVRGTRAALSALADAGLIAAEDAQTLGEGYDRLRVIEHRLQMVEDRQTHSLPCGEGLDDVARLDGLADGVALVAELDELTDQTGRIYDALIGERPHTPQAPPPANQRVQHLTQLGFADPEALAKRIEGWRDGRYTAIRSPQALEVFDQLLPVLLERFAGSDDPERALIRWQTILERTQSLITLFHLLLARPEVLDRLVAALTLSPLLADELARRPELLDGLVSDEHTEGVDTFGGDAFRSEVAEQIREGAARDDLEATLDAIRQVVGERRFGYGVSLIEAEEPANRIGAALSGVAEAAIAIAVEACEREFAQAHGRIEGGELIVVGLGRLGGGALTHTSDLDMIYLFTGDFASMSDGERPLSATHYFNRLASRVSAALSVPTAQGALYEVDTRLRPEGKQGPLAVSLAAFAKYQRQSAWTWEHMALTRARVLVGSDEVNDEITAIVREIASRARDVAELRAAVLSMRGEMAQHKEATGPLDVKHSRAGLVDVEFLVHYLQLRYARELVLDDHPIIAPSLMASIRMLARIDILPTELIEAYDLLTGILVAGRLLAPDGKEPPPAAAKALALACGRTSYAELTGDLFVARACVARCWAASFDEELELD